MDITSEPVDNLGTTVQGNGDGLVRWDGPSTLGPGGEVLVRRLGSFGGVFVYPLRSDKGIDLITD
jgi:hypothetical protein